MPKKKANTAKPNKAPNKAQPPKKAIPPPDNPFLRSESQQAMEGSGIEDDGEQAAELRAKAIEQAREMPE